MASSSRGVGRAAALLLAAVTGAAAALLGAFVHTAAVVVAGVTVPVGLVPAVAFLLIAGLLGIRHSGSAGAWASATGWILTILLLSWPRAAGDIVVPGTWYGYAFMGLGMLAAVGLIVRAWWLELPMRGASGGPSPVR